MSVLYIPSILDDDYKFSASGIYYAPSDCQYADYIEFIEELPAITKPEAFGLRENADITKDQKEADELLSAVEATQLGCYNRVVWVVLVAKAKKKWCSSFQLSLQQKLKLPAAFDIELARYKYPVTYLESMNSVLHQEMIRFNRLTDVIRSSLVTVQKTLRGLVVMSADIDKLITNIFQSIMPVMWAPYSYPTMKPVSSYFASGDECRFSIRVTSRGNAHLPVENCTLFDLLNLLLTSNICCMDLLHKCKCLIFLLIC